MKSFSCDPDVLRALGSFIMRINGAAVDANGVCLYYPKKILDSLEMYQSLGFDTFNGVNVDDMLSTALNLFQIEEVKE